MGEIHDLLSDADYKVLGIVAYIPYNRQGCWGSLAIYCSDGFPNTIISLPLQFPFRFYINLAKMADNLYRAMQEINLGEDDDPIPLPPAICHQAERE